MPLFKHAQRASLWLSCKESTCNAGNAGSIPEWGRFPGGGNGNPLQYSCLGNPMDRGTGATAQGVTKSRTQLSTLRPIPQASKHTAELSLLLLLFWRSRFSCVQPFVRLWTIARQAPLSMGWILQARKLERVAKPSSRRSSPRRNRTYISYVSCVGRKVPYH